MPLGHHNGQYLELHLNQGIELMNHQRHQRGQSGQQQMPWLITHLSQRHHRLTAVAAALEAAVNVNQRHSSQAMEVDRDDRVPVKEPPIPFQQMPTLQANATAYQGASYAKTTRGEIIISRASG